MKITKNLQKNKNSIYFFLINKNFKKNNKKKINIKQQRKI